MKPVFTVNEMQDADSKTIRLLNGNASLLMEHAGTACVNVLLSHFENCLSKKNILIICGKGNNGGDGIVIARQLISYGYDVKLFVIEGVLSKDCQFQLEIFKNYSENIVYLNENNLELFQKALMNADILIDSILGTGLKSDVKGIYKTIIDEINSNYNKFLFSVDIPSGLSGDFGIVSGSFLKADITVTFGAYKKCHIFSPSTDYCGKVYVDRITIPNSVYKSVESKLVIIDKEDIVDLSKYKDKDTHKGTFGHVGIIGGEKGKLGASVLSAISALKSGAGLATIFTSHENYKTVSTYYPEIMFDIFDEYSNDCLIEFLNGKDSIVVGPGLGVSEFSKNIVKTLASNYDGNVVLDADVFRNFNKAQLKDLKFANKAVLTPHPGEMADFLDLKNIDIQNNRLEKVSSISNELKLVTVLKGYQTLISNKGNTTYLNTTGSPALSTAGSGDVLAGIIGSFLAQGYDLLKSAISGVYLHGLSGDIAEKSETRACVTATSIIEYLNQAFLR